MPPWLQDTFEINATTSELCVRLGLAILFGWLAAGVYRWTRPLRPENRTFPGTLLLLCVLIAMVTQVIGDNVARAFSLVGALSIVRFRTVVQDTQDTAFVIFAVAVGMAVGAGQPQVALLGSGAIMVCAWFLKEKAVLETVSPGTPYLLDIRLGWSKTAEQELRALLPKYAQSIEPQGAATAKQGSAINLLYRLQLPATVELSTLIAELNRVDSVQAVELKRIEAE